MDNLSTWAAAYIEGDNETGRKIIAEGRKSLSIDLPEGKLLRKPFHWALEFPEVFERGGFDGIVGNPPFLGGKRLTTVLGEFYPIAIKTLVSSEKGASDLCAYFFVHSYELLKNSGVLGLVATNSISQGDTRDVGLAQIEARGGQITAAWPSMKWQGRAGVTVSPCVIYKGHWSGIYHLNGLSVGPISSYLDDEHHKLKLRKLYKNEGIASIGTYVNGKGFILDKLTYEKFVQEDPRNNEVLSRYLSSQDLNQSPSCTPSRIIINFGDMPREVAATYVAPFEHVVKFVKPQRDKLTRQIHESCFWKHWDRRESTYEKTY